MDLARGVESLLRLENPARLFIGSADLPPSSAGASRAKGNQERMATRHLSIKLPSGDPNPPAWWYSRLDTEDPPADDFMAKCPAHDDHNPSLHVSKTRSGSLIHCFAGCTYQSILEAIEGERPALNGTQPSRPVVSIVTASSGSPLTWFSTYTGVPREFLDSLPLDERLGSVRFLFDGVDKVKERKSGTKAFAWTPTGGKVPPFWPVPAIGISDSIVITEGETDAIVARYLGADAYAITSGAGNPPDVLAFSYLRSLGVASIVLIPDVDSAGSDGAAVLVQAAEDAGLVTDVLELGAYVIPVFGEKDLRDVYKRLGRDASIATLGGALNLVTSYGVTADEYLTDIPEVDWIAKPFLAKGMVTLISGQPKAGKTTILLKLICELGPGGLFMGHPVRRASAYYLTEFSRPVFKSKWMDHLQGRSLDHLLIVDRFDPRLRAEVFTKTFPAIAREASARGAEVLIVDTLATWADWEDENSATDVGPALRAVRTAASRYNLAVVLVHHVTKGGSGPRGSSAIAADVDTLIDVTGEGTAPRRMVVKSNVLLPSEPIEFFMTEEGDLEVIDRDSLVDDPDAQAALEVLPEPDEEHIGVTDVATLTHLDRDRTRAALTRLFKVGRLERIKGPRGAHLYRLKVEGGEAFSISIVTGRKED